KITDDGGATVTVQATAHIADTGISASPLTISPTEGSAFTGPVATFVSTSSSSVTSDFTATIDWGDSSPTSSGTITLDAGTFSVAGTHTYADEGNKAVTVNVVSKGGSTATGNSQAQVQDAALTGTPGSLTFPTGKNT